MGRDRSGVDRIHPTPRPPNATRVPPARAHLQQELETQLSLARARLPSDLATTGRGGAREVSEAEAAPRDEERGSWARAAQERPTRETDAVLLGSVRFRRARRGPSAFRPTPTSRTRVRSDKHPCHACAARGDSASARGRLPPSPRRHLARRHLAAYASEAAHGPAHPRRSRASVLPSRPESPSEDPGSTATSCPPPARAKRQARTGPTPTAGGVERYAREGSTDLRDALDRDPAVESAVQARAPERQPRQPRGVS